MVQFMQENKALGVESMCKELAIAPSTYYRHVQLQRHPERRGAQVRQREARLVEIKRVYDESNGIYGARKVWRQLLREGITMAHGTVERLMRRAGLQGVWRGKGKRTTVSEGRSDLPDLVKRDFSASRPNQLWVADFTYVPTRSGYVYTAFVIDVYIPAEYKRGPAPVAALQRTAGGGRRESIGGYSRRLLRQRTGGKHHWPVQNGSH